MKVKFTAITIIVMMLSNLLPSQTVVVKEHNDKTLFWIEAEAGEINDPMMVYERNAASGGQFIEVKSGIKSFNSPPPDGQVIYKFNVVNAGIYKIWCRVKIDMDREDAFWVKMDDDDWIKWQEIAVGCEGRRPRASRVPNLFEQINDGFSQI